MLLDLRENSRKKFLSIDQQIFIQKLKKTNVMLKWIFEEKTSIHRHWT